MKSILDAINKDTSIAAGTLKELQTKIRVKTFKKGAVLQRQGDVNTYCYFVKSGLLRSFTSDQKGNEHIFMFAPEGWTIADIVSQILCLPTDLIIDVLEESELEIFNLQVLEGIFANDPKLNKQGNFILAKRTAVLQKRVIMLISATALECYLYFLETYAEIVQRVTQKMIASYLG